MAMTRAEVSIQGMHCGGCAAKIKAALLDVVGVESADVNPTAGTAIITLSSSVSDERIENAVASAGDYVASSVGQMETEDIPGMKPSKPIGVADEPVKDADHGCDGLNATVCDRFARHRLG